MITAQRQRRRRRASAVVASLAVATGLVATAVAPVGAASTATYVGPTSDHTATVRGTIDGEPFGGEDGNVSAGLFDLVIDGEVETNGYCIDINTPIPADTDLDEIDWDTSGVENLSKVEAILRHYHPNGVGPDDHEITGSDAQKAAATQAAIWHYTDGFELNLDDTNDATIVSNYEAILAAVEAGLEGFGEPTVTLSITPPASTEGLAGELVGPYVVNTSADSVALTASEGVTLHDAEGNELEGDVVDGTEVWLKGSAEGTGTITATADAEVGAGRVFFTQGVQRLVLASTVVTDASAEAGVSFTAPSTSTTQPPSTTETTAPATTSTTVPITPQTTEVEAPTTTVPIVPAANGGGGGGLPVTGAQSLVLVGVALALVVAGAGFGIVSRRKRLEES